MRAYFVAKKEKREKDSRGIGVVYVIVDRWPPSSEAMQRAFYHWPKSQTSGRTFLLDMHACRRYGG
jgi:hypothetical protein